VITFKSTEDLAKLQPDNPAFPTVQKLVDRLITAYTEPGQSYNWQHYGYVILIQQKDVNRTLDEIWDGCTLLDIYWEGIMKQGDFFIAIYLANN
jgi:tRNA uridine 5-carbamoylmethylation protein Kti12